MALSPMGELSGGLRWDRVDTEAHDYSPLLALSDRTPVVGD